jgi:hypothetical protein
MKKDVSSVRKSTREAVASMRTGFWLDEPPAQGPAPPYTRESWPTPKRLLVWREPGKSGVLTDPANWLEDGKPMESWPGAQGDYYGAVYFGGETDMLFPAAGKEYRVGPRKRVQLRLRHITVESGVRAGYDLNHGAGNIWIDEDADADFGGGAFVGGERHTFVRNGDPRPLRGPVDLGAMLRQRGNKYFARKWVVRKDRKDASLTLMGSLESGDETHFVRGRVVVDEDTVISIGPRCCQHVDRDAVLELRSGAVLGKNGNQLHKWDMMVKGVLLAGSPVHPLTKDVYLGLSLKDEEKVLVTKGGRSLGLVVSPAGRMAVHSSAPERHRLRIRWHGTQGGSDDGTPGGFLDKNRHLADKLKLNMIVLGKAELDGVEFDDFGKGGVRLLDPAMRRKWKNVSYGENVACAPEELYARFTDEDTLKDLARSDQKSIGYDRSLDVRAGKRR